MIKSKLLKDLNSEQIEAVTHKEGPLLIIAGAGTGKTTVIAHRVAWLIEQQLAQPSEILALTFTEKAAREMDGRIMDLLPLGVLDFTATTFHGFCQEILKNYGIIAGISPDFQLLTESQQILFLRQHLDEFDLNLYKPISNPNKFLAALVKLFSRAKDENISAKDYLKLAETYKKKSANKLEDLELAENFVALSEQANAYKKYEDLKNQNSYYDFGDLLVKTHWMLKNRPSILSKLREKYKYIFVDEFQDTNYIQAQIAYLLAGEKQNITVVGDDDQSIYKFRGASIANIMDFVTEYPKSKKVVLVKNYRSTKQILDASYKLIVNNNPERLEIQEKIDKKLVSEINGTKPKYWHFSNGLNESEEIFAHIESKVKKGKKYGDFAILVRANNHADDLIDLLRAKNIPYHFAGSRGLYDREEIRELRSYLTVLSNPDNNLALFYVASAKQFNIDRLLLRRLTNLAKIKNISLFEIFRSINNFTDDGKSTKPIKKIVDLIMNHLDISTTWTTSKILIDYIMQSGMYARIKDINSYEDQEKTENLRLFFRKISEFERVSRDKSIFSFGEYLDIIIEAGDNPPIFEADKHEDAVNIMTIHSAKGLEFDTVFLINLIDGRFPSRSRKEQIELPTELIKEKLPEGDIHLQEERRLFYVGATRAKCGLYLTSSDTYSGGKDIRKISNFISETISKEDYSEFGTKKTLDFLDNTISIDTPLVKVKNIEKLSLSPSNLETFNDCPLKFEYSYIFKLGGEESHTINFGNSVHNTLRDAYVLILSGVKLDQKKIHDLYENNWKTEGYETKLAMENSYKKGLDAIEGMLNNDDSIPIAIEQRFNFLVNKNCELHGRIDRIDKTNDGIEIIDYKTGDGAKKTTSEVTKNLPLWVYAMSLEKENEKINLALYYVMNQKKITFLVTEKKFAEKREKITNLCAKIQEALENNIFPATPSERTCGFCAYKSICPYKAKRA